MRGGSLVPPCGWRLLFKWVQGFGFGVQIRQDTSYYFTEMFSGSEVGSYSRLIDFVYHSNQGLRVIKKKQKDTPKS